MVSKHVRIINPTGLHLRPAGLLCQTAMKFKSDIQLYVKADPRSKAEEKKIAAKSVLNVMAAGIKCGTEVTVSCDGTDEETALKAVCDLIESGLGEKV